MMRLGIRLGLLCGVIGITGCSLSPIKVAPESQYTITQWPVTTASNKPASTKATLLVTRPLASPGFESSRMVYVTIPYQLKSFANNRWVAPPSELLLPLLTDRIRHTHYFHAVMSAPYVGVATYQLNTQVLTLQQEFLQPTSQVRLVMSAAVLNALSGRVLASRVFEVVVPAPGNNPYSGVLATNEAANQVMSKISLFAMKTIQTHP